MMAMVVSRCRMHVGRRHDDIGSRRSATATEPTGCRRATADGQRRRTCGEPDGDRSTSVDERPQLLDGANGVAADRVDLQVRHPGLLVGGDAFADVAGRPDEVRLLDQLGRQRLGRLFLLAVEVQVLDLDRLVDVAVLLAIVL